MASNKKILDELSDLKHKPKDTVTTSVTISNTQHKWIKKNNINFSKLVQNAITQAMIGNLK